MLYARSPVYRTPCFDRVVLFSRVLCNLGVGHRNVNIHVDASPRNPRVGKSVELRCTVSGDPRSVVAWTRYGGHLPPTARQHNERLSIANLRPDDGGIYVCTVTTPNGVFEETYALVIQSRCIQNILTTASIIIIIIIKIIIIIMIIIYCEFLPPLRRGSHVKSDGTHTMVQHTPLSPYVSHMLLDFQ